MTPSPVSGSTTAAGGNAFSRMSLQDQFLAAGDEVIYGTCFIIEEDDSPPRRVDPKLFRAVAETGFRTTPGFLFSMTTAEPS